MQICKKCNNVKNVKSTKNKKSTKIKKNIWMPAFSTKKSKNNSNNTKM